MRRNPDEQIIRLKEQFLLGDESVTEFLWNSLNRAGEIPTHLQELLVLCGDNNQQHNFVIGWTRWFEKSPNEGRFYCVLIAYATLLTALEYYAREYALIKSLPEAKNGWKEYDDLFIPLIERQVVEWLMAFPFGIGVPQIEQFLIDHLEEVALPRNSDSNYRIPHQNVGRHLISNIFENKASLEMDPKLMFLRTVVKSIFEPAWNLIHAIICPDADRLYIDTTSFRLDPIFHAPRILVHCWVSYAQYAYLDAIQAFRSNVLTQDDQNVFDTIWRRKIKFLLLTILKL